MVEGEKVASSANSIKVVREDLGKLVHDRRWYFQQLQSTRMMQNSTKNHKRSCPSRSRTKIEDEKREQGKRGKMRDCSSLVAEHFHARVAFYRGSGVWTSKVIYGMLKAKEIFIVEGKVWLCLSA
jgi:hypothetical protein